MSLTHNMKQTFSGALEGQTKIYSSVLPLAPSVAMFYLVNSNATDEEMKKFSKDQKIEESIVKEYFLARKKQEKINSNILNMKYSMDYIGANAEEIQNYESQNLSNFTPGISDIEMSFHDIISQNIPKKARKPEFQVINDIKSDGKDGREKNSNFSNFANSGNSSLNSQNVQNSHPSKDTFSYSSQVGTTNSTTSTSTSTSYQSLPSKIDDVKQIPTLIACMNNESKLEHKLQISNILIKIESFSLLDRFIYKDGNRALGVWIEELMKQFESNEKLDPRIFTLLTNLLNFCDLLPITVEELKTSKIGKKINKLGKSVSDRLIKTKCEELVSKWKKIIENIKDKKGKERDREKDDYRGGSNYKEKESNSHSSHSSSHRHKNSHTSSNSRHSPSPDHSLSKKTKRDEKHGHSHSSSHNDNFYSSSFSSTTAEQTDKSNKKARADENNNSNTFSYSSQIVNTNQSMMKKDGVQFSQQINSSSGPHSQSTILTKLKTTSVVKKSILKKTEMPKKSDVNSKKPKIRWENDSKIEKVKIFISNDEPGAGEVTEEQYRKIQMEILSNPNYKYSSDLRSKEIHMEKENMSKAREKSKIAKEILKRMVPQMNWRRPYEIKINSNSHLQVDEDENDLPFYMQKGSESEEKQMIDILCQKILSVTYFRESEIPDAPKMGAEQLFCFTNEEIPKIENLKKAYNPDKPNPNAEILDQINKNYEVTPSPDFIKTLITKIQEKEFSPEESAKIMEYLNKHSSKDSQQTSLPNPMLNRMPMPIPPFPNFNNFNLNMNNPINFNISNKAPLNSINSQMGLGSIMQNTPNVPIIGMHNQNMNQSGQLNQISPHTHHSQQSHLPMMPTHFPNPNANPNFVRKPLPAKYKTRPCNNFHGPNGCSRGDHCHFIHDLNYPGKEIPNFNYNNYTNISEKKVLITNVNIVNNFSTTPEPGETGETYNPGSQMSKDENESSLEDDGNSSVKSDENKSLPNKNLELSRVNNFNSPQPQQTQQQSIQFPNMINPMMMLNKNFGQIPQGGSLNSNPTPFNMQNNPQNLQRPPFPMMNIRPPFNMQNMNMGNMSNLNPHFMNSNPYMMNFIRPGMNMNMGNMNMQNNLNMMPSQSGQLANNNLSNQNVNSSGSTGTGQ